MISYDDFEKIDMRVGKIMQVDDFPQARKPAYQLTIDFGPEIGLKRSSAQITNYPKEELLGKLVIGVVNTELPLIGMVSNEQPKGVLLQIPFIRLVMPLLGHRSIR